MASEGQDALIRDYTDEDVRAGITFYIVFMVVMIGMYVMALVTNPALRSPSRLIPFTLMLLMHAAMHWVILFRAGQRRWIAPYLVVQGVLLFAINYMGQNQGLLLGLYFAQIGAAVGVLGSLRKSLIPIAAYAVLGTVNYGLIWGWENIAWWVALAIPMGLFVVIYVTMFNRQASARQQAQQLLKELEAAHVQLTEYAERVEALTLATERQRMARELHDTLAQGLAGLILQLEAVDAHLGRNQAQKAQAIVHQAMERARSTLADARRAIQDLRSDKAAVEDLGEAVHAEVERFTDATGIPCSLDMMLPKDIPTEIGEHVQRAVAEGLTNIARHAQATLVEMRIGQEEERLEILIRDDGIGFDLTALSESGGHYGLVGLRERARLAGGDLQVISAPGAGTTLSIRLPLEPAGAER